jgi:FtsZ-binding cell division protein ZapB
MILFGIVQLTSLGVIYGTVKTQIGTLQKEIAEMKDKNTMSSDKASEWREAEPSRIALERSHNMLPDCRAEFSSINRTLGELQGSVKILLDRKR